jgi:hypothetical protein
MSNHITWFECPSNYAIQFNFIEGNGAAKLNEEKPLTFHESLIQLDDLIAQQKIEQRDLKCRFDGCHVEIANQTIMLTIKVGATHYYACIDDIEKLKETTEKIQRGLERHQDSKYYLNCGMGVTIVPYTSNGQVLLGIRRGEIYHQWLHGIGGWLPFERKVSLINPFAHAQLECFEELGIKQSQLNPLELLGLISFKNSFETDFVFGMKISNEMIENIIKKQHWKNAQDANEHEQFVLVNYNKINNLKIVPSTAFGLQRLFDSE